MNNVCSDLLNLPLISKVSRINTVFGFEVLPGTDRSYDDIGGTIFLRSRTEQEVFLRNLLK